MDYRETLAVWFAEDDGSLPELRLVNLHPSEVDGILQQLVSRTAGNVQVTPFHFVITVVVDGQPIPQLGVGHFDDAVHLDWRMGPEWTSLAIECFMKLVRDLLANCEDPRIQLEPGVTSEASEAFRRGWTHFQDSHP